MQAHSSLLEIRGFGRVNVHECLGVYVDKWEPRALHLHHDAMSTAKRMVDIRHHKLHLRHFARIERFGLLEAITVTSAHRFPAHELLVTPRSSVCRARAVHGHILWI